MKLSERIIEFYKSLKIPNDIPDGIEAMDPYQDERVMQLVERFYGKFFNDSRERVMLVGINPGRFGGGITGIPFTDPLNLKNICGIDNDLNTRHELSSRFIYEMIGALGGPEKFYGGIYITAASPIGFVRDDKNLNYYDDRVLQENWMPFIERTLRIQAEFCRNNIVCFSLGQGKNFHNLVEINKRLRIFSEVKALPHPRWVMQYRLKRKDEFIEAYSKALSPFL